MIPDSLDFILRPVTDEQAEYAAAHQTPAPMTEGEAGFGAGQTPASPTVPLGEAGPHSSDADAVGAPASEAPAWFIADHEKQNAALAKAGALVEHPDGFISINPSKVSPAALSAYQMLCRYGAANGWL